MGHRESQSRIRMLCMLALVAAVLGSAAGRALAATDRCALLKDGEIDEAIGPHERGTSDVNNPWGTNSCRWTAKGAPAGKAPEGWRDSIELGVFEGSMISWAKDHTRGEPIAGAAKDAKWDKTYGELWFSCAGARICVVKVRTAASAQREALATKLARLVDGRLR